MIVRARPCWTTTTLTTARSTDNRAQKVPTGDTGQGAVASPSVDPIDLPGNHAKVQCRDVPSVSLTTLGLGTLLTEGLRDSPLQRFDVKVVLVRGPADVDVQHTDLVRCESRWSGDGSVSRLRGAASGFCSRSLGLPQRLSF